MILQYYCIIFNVIYKISDPDGENGISLGSYLLRGPPNKTVRPSVSFTIETNWVLLTEWTTLLLSTIPVTLNKDDPRVICDPDTDGPTAMSDGPRNK